MDADVPSLHQSVLDDPAFFAELVSFSWRRDDQLNEDPGDPAEVQRRTMLATHANEVLESLPTCPGVDAKGLLDGAVLRNWVRVARSELQRLGKSRVGDRRLGGILARAPHASDGSRINETVRALLEEVGSDELDVGFLTALYNERGVTSRPVMEGGSQEWALVDRFNKESDAVRNWPRSRKILKELAESFAGEARRHDDQAERRQRGIGW